MSGEIKRHFRDRRWQIRVQRQDQELLEMRAAEETVPGIGRFLREAGMDGDPAGSTAADSG